MTEHTDRELPDRFEATGIPNIKKVRTEFSNLLNDPGKVSRNILSENDVVEIDVDNARIMVIRVPEADYRQKPIYLNKNRERSCKRTFEGDYLLTDEDIAMMVRDSMTEASDFSLMEHCGMSHIDAETLRKYRTAFNIRNTGHPFSDLSDKEFLIQMGGYMVDEVSGKEGLTLAGVLMFGKVLTVRNLFPNLRMDYLDLSNIPAGSGLKWNERLTYDGRWENNLYNFITFVMGKITFGIPSPGVVKGTVRNDDSLVYQALREGVTNSVIHSDFRVEGTLRIDKRDDSIELRNPGILKLSREKIYKGNHSRARNPKIQDMLRMIGFGDNIGSGFPLILKAWNEESWIKPDLNEDRDLCEVSLKLKMSSIYAPEVINEVAEVYGTDFDGLSVQEKECLVLILSEKAQTNSVLQLYTGRNGWELNRILTALTSKKFLISHPNGRWTTYEPNLDYCNSHRENNKENNKENNGGKEIRDRAKENGSLSQIPKGIWDDILTEKQKIILNIINDNPLITFKELGVLIHMSYMAIRTQRSRMEKVGIYLVREGSTKAGSWRIEYRGETQAADGPYNQ